MKSTSDFLTMEEEFIIKQDYEKQKQLGNIDKDIIPALDKLNGIDGLVTLHSCQGHLDKPRSYVAIKISEYLVYPFTETVWDLIEEYQYLKVDWGFEVNYFMGDLKTRHESTILRGNMNCDYMFELANRLI